MSKSYEIRAKPIDTANHFGLVLGLRFTEQGDRFGHHVFVESKTGGQTGEQILLSSLEGSDQQAWPPSPPFQDMHRQEMDGGAVVMGVGMAGTGHWSMSCELDQKDQNPQRIRFVFDIACRIKSAPEFLGTTYEGIAADRSDDARQQMAELGLEVHIDSQSVTGQESGQMKVLADLDSSGKDSKNAATSSTAQTIRWLYAIEVTT